MLRNKILKYGVAEIKNQTHIESRLPKLTISEISNKDQDDWRHTKIEFSKQFGLKKIIDIMNEEDEDFENVDEFHNFEVILKDKLAKSKDTRAQLGIFII